MFMFIEYITNKLTGLTFPFMQQKVLSHVEIKNEKVYKSIFGFFIHCLFRSMLKL